MAFSRKNKRRIVVDGQEYFWAVSGDDGWINVRVMVDVPGGQALVCYFDYHQDRIPRGEGAVSLVNQFVVTPYTISQVIRHGLANGWTPTTGGSELNLGHLDAVIDLRLDRNREDVIKRPDGGR